MGNKDEQARHERKVLENVLHHLIESNDVSCYFGFDQKDIERVHAAFTNLRQNPNTEFPDFSNGEACVELFAISSSAQGGRGGSMQMRQNGKLRKKIKLDDKNAAENDDHSCRSYARVHPSHTYEALTKSLHTSFDNHVRSLRKSSVNYGTRVFVIEYQDFDLHCTLTPATDVDCNGLCMGDLAPLYGNGKCSGIYRLSRDKDSLLWLGERSDDVDYVVFCGCEVVEAINLHRTNEIAAFLPWKLNAVGAYSVTLAKSVYLGSAGWGGFNEQD